MRLRSSLLALGLLFLASPTRAQDAWGSPYAGVMHLHRTTSAPQEVHAVLADLCTPGMRVRASRSEERARTVSSFAHEVGAEVAINGDFFSWEDGYDTIGLAMGDGETWPGTFDDEVWALTAFGPGRAQVFAEPAVVEPEAWMSEAVGGVPQLVADGMPIASYPGWSFCAARHPRTALGLTEDARTLILVTVDGRSERSVGMTCPELAELMADLGAHDAVNLDGGGSTALYLADRGVTNRPSDGTERVVANHLGLVLDGSTGVDACPGGGEPPPPGGWARCELQGARPGETVTIDETHACFAADGPSWFEGPDHGYTYAVDCGAEGPRACARSDTSGRWLFHVAEAGTYRVEAHVPAGGATDHAFSGRAPYRLEPLEGARDVRIDQEAARGRWVPLAELELAVQNNVAVRLHDNTGEPYTGGATDRVVVFDRLRVIGEAPPPTPDAGPVSADAGATSADAGPGTRSDAGHAPDASDGATTDPGGGCSAGGPSGPSGPPLGAIVAVSLLAARSRRRSSRRAPPSLGR
ncbi:MAG TPA: phosphodiester glycosidase family protein [Sandaracinaceae bacterium LLY-WYZ-13_1]|nr:phosphodiester glycosidase family protein [Sandaracinaceae bacterium LLY-WYZ-13_1]